MKPSKRYQQDAIIVAVNSGPLKHLLVLKSVSPLVFLYDWWIVDASGQLRKKSSLFDYEGPTQKPDEYN